MIPSRQTSRVVLRRVGRSPIPRQNIRFQSTSSPSASSNSHFTAGIAGGLAGATLLYGIYSFTPAGRTASKINKAAKEAELKYLQAAKKLQDNTPSSDQAIDSIKQFAYSYVGWIPGGKAYVDTAFEDWEKVRENHKDEADELVQDAYKQFQDLSKTGLSLETASKAYEVMADLAKKVAGLSGDAISDILDNHPQIKERLGGNVDQLKRMGETYGPEAKKQVDETWKQLKDLAAGGLSAANLDKARKLIEEKMQAVSKLGDEAWQKGLEQAKPMLEKNPKVKKLIESNADALKQGNAKELFEKAKAAVDSDNLGDLEKYVKDTIGKYSSSSSGGSSSAGGLEKYFNIIPQGDQILPKLKQLGEVADKHKDEGEKLLKETVEEIKKVLEEKGKRAEEIVEKAKKDAK